MFGDSKGAAEGCDGPWGGERDSDQELSSGHHHRS